MEGNKLDLSGKKEEKQPLASYKAVPEADMEEEVISSPKAVIKVKNYSGADGADEKMLPDDDPKFNSNNIDISDHRVIIPEKNGDAKVDIAELKIAFAGLGKEELMKYANDPFWVKIRWFLFIMFWLLWLGMLLGAVSIIYTAPKCNPPPPRQWWEEGPLAEIKSEISADELKQLKASGIKGVIVEYPDDSYEEIKDDHNVLGLLNKSIEFGIPVIMDLEASMSNIWFEKSESKQDYADYYIWKESEKTDANGVKEPPNNWVSRKNQTSWKFSTVRNEFYYAPEGWPQLNFRNENVTREFGKVLEKFAKKGAKGFRIRDAHILLVDNNFKNELPDNSKEVKEKEVFLMQYGYYMHSKTEHLTDLGPLLKNWRKIAKNCTGNGPFMAKNVLHRLEAYTVNSTLVVDLPSQENVLNKPVFDVEKVAHALEHAFKTQRFNWPLWVYKTDSLPADVLDTITYILPGVPLLEGGQAVNVELAKIRISPPVMRGELEYKAVANKTVLAFTRFAPGSPGVLAAINPSNKTVIVNFEQDMDKISSEVTVHFLSKNFNETDYGLGVKKEASSIPISARSSIVLTYTAKKEEEE